MKLHNNRQAAIIASALILGLLLPGIGILELRGEEATRILPAYAMLDSGRWLEPELLGQPYANKPPFINWCVAGTTLLCGARSEASARLASVLFLVLLGLAITLGAGPLLSPEQRLFSALLVVVNGAFLEKGRLIEIEAVYVALTGLAVVSFLAALSQGRKGLALYGPPIIPLSLGMLTKGPLHLIAYAGAAMGLLCAFGRGRELRRPWLYASALMSALPLSAWALWTQRKAQGGANDKGARWAEELGSRLDPAAFELGTSALSVLSALALFLPASAALLCLCRKSDAAEPPGRARALRGLLLGTLGAFVAIACLPGLKTRYLFVTLPGFALAAGGLLPGLPWTRLEARLLRALLGLLSLSGLLILILLLREFETSVAGVLSLLAFAALSVSWLRPLPGRLEATVRIAVCLASLLCAMLPYQEDLARAVANRRLEGQHLAAIVGPEDTLAVWQPGRISFLYYLPRGSRIAEDAQDLAGADWLLLRAADLKDLAAFRPDLRTAQEALRLNPRLRGDWRLFPLSR